MNLKYFISIHCIIISFYLIKISSYFTFIAFNFISQYSITYFLIYLLQTILFYSFCYMFVCVCVWRGVSEFHSSLYYSANLRFCYSFFYIWHGKKENRIEGSKTSNLWEKLIRKSCKFTKERVIQLLEQRLIYRDRMKKNAQCI